MTAMDACGPSWPEMVDGGRRPGPNHGSRPWAEAGRGYTIRGARSHAACSLLAGYPVGRGCDTSGYCHRCVVHRPCLGILLAAAATL